MRHPTTRPIRRRRHAMAAIIGSVVLLSAACSSDDPSVDASGDSDTPEATTTTAAPTPVACDVALNTKGYYRDAELAGAIIGSEPADDGDEHGHEGDDGHGGEDMDHDGDGESDAPHDMSGGLGEVQAATIVQRLVDMDDETYEQWLQSLDPNRDVEAPDDTGQGGHLGPQTWEHVTDAEECQLLESELDQAYEVAKKFPKAQDAIDAGYARVAPYLPGIASHWMNFGLVDDDFEVTKPEMLLYDGNAPEANLVGLSYFIRQSGDAEPSDGFSSPNDHYHRHEGLCIGATGVIGDSTTTEEECESLGGHKSNGASGWMSHAWVVPGCESPWGVFSAQNPVLDRALVDSSGVGEPCSGSKARDRWDLTAAEESAAGGDHEPAPAE